jgi:hypothetical protein
MGRVVRWVSVLFAVVALGTVAFAAGESKAPVAKGKEVTITGKISCTFCRLAHPEQSCHPSCCATCVKAGDPTLLTDAQGNQYVLLTSEKGVPLMNPERQAMLGSTVTIKGVLVKGKGVQAIFVDSMVQAVAAR